MTKSPTKFIALMALCLFSLMFITSEAQANISLDKVIVTFSPDARPVDNITVTNHSEETVRVTGAVMKIANSGQPTETENPATDLVLAPKIFELKPGESRMARLVVRNFPENMEDIYRVRFKPDQAFDQEQTTPSGTSVKVSVVMTMGALVMVQPKNPQPNLVVTRDANQLHFDNQGNITVQLQREDFCNKDRSVCTPLDGKRIYPGMKWETDIPAGLKNQPFSQTILVKGDYSTLAYPMP